MEFIDILIMYLHGVCSQILCFVWYPDMSSFWDAWRMADQLFLLAAKHSDRHVQSVWNLQRDINKVILLLK